MNQPIPRPNSRSFLAASGGLLEQFESIQLKKILDQGFSVTEKFVLIQYPRGVEFIGPLLRDSLIR